MDHPRLQFTIEHEVNNQLPFLDVLVTRNETGLHTTVHVKPTANQRYLDFLSPSPPQHKYATARSLLARAYYFPDSHLKRVRQLNLWSDILRSNNYPQTYLDRILHTLRRADLPRALRPLTNVVDLQASAPPTPPTQWIAMPYVPQLHRRLQSLMPENVRLAPISHDQIRNLYSVAKDSLTDGAITNIIYSIPCKPDHGTTCTATYIGQTMLSLRRRIINHQSTYAHRPLACSLFTHVSSNPGVHTIDFDHPTILDRTTKRKELHIREAWAIQNSSGIMNAALECTPLPGPFRGLQQIAKSDILKLSLTKKRKRPVPKPLTLRWCQPHIQNPAPPARQIYPHSQFLCHRPHGPTHATFCDLVKSLDLNFPQH